MTAAGFATVDAMAEYSFDDKTSLKLSVTNLADKLYADTLYRALWPRRCALCATDAEDTLLSPQQAF